MRAEIIAVGTELLLGQIVNTNAQYLSQQCADLGIDLYYQTVVGDNAGRLKDALTTARSRADLIICTGGLGPTQDDLTKDVLAEFLGRPLILHAPAMEKIISHFQARGIHMVESNKRQAHLIEGAKPLANDTGLAVGAALESEGTHYILLPGPPKEMKPMFENYASPWLTSLLAGGQPLYSRMLKFAGIGESSLEHALADLISSQHDPSIAPYAKEGEVLIRLSTKAGSQAEADAKMIKTESIIRERVGAYLFAEEDIALEEAVIRRMKKLKLTLSAAESCTGGLLSQLLTAIPGSSAVFRGSVVCYTNGIKRELLNVPQDVLEGPGAPGAVSQETAVLLAENVMKLNGSDFAVSITGVAGPDTSEGKPVGLVYVAVAGRDGMTRCEQLQLFGNRETIRLRAAKQALYFLWKTLVDIRL